MLSYSEIATVTLLPAVVAGNSVATFLPPASASRHLSDGDAAATLAPLASTERPLRAVVGCACALSLAFVIAFLSYETVTRQHNSSPSLLGDTAADPAKSWVSLLVQVIRESAWPTQAHDWIPVVGLIVAATSAVWTLIPGRWKFVTLAIQCGLGTALVARLLWTSVYMTNQWSTVQSACWLFGVGIPMGGIWWLLGGRPKDSDRNDRLLLGESSVIAAALALTLASSGSITYGALGSGLASSLAGGWIVSVWRDRCAPRFGWAGPVVVFSGLLLILGYFFAELSALHAILFAMSFFLIAVVPPTQQWSLRLVHVLGVIAPALVAATLAILAALHSQSNNPYYS